MSKKKVDCIQEQENGIGKVSLSLSNWIHVVAVYTLWSSGYCGNMY